MGPKSERPEAHHRPGPSKVDQRRSDRAEDNPLDACNQFPTVDSIFWVTVDERGREHVWRRPYAPRHPDHRVKFDRDDGGRLVEEICTVNAKLSRGSCAEIVSVPPRGDGWVMDDAVSDNHTVWRRPVVEVDP